MKKKWEYLIANLFSLGLFEFGLYVALAWYWSKFQWSPFGYETCGMEFLYILFFVSLCSLRGEVNKSYESNFCAENFLKLEGHLSFCVATR